MQDTTASKNILSGFAYHLAEHGLLDKEIALNALQLAAQHNNSYIEYLAKKKIIDEVKVARAAADYFGFPLFDITSFDTNLIPTEYLNIQLVKKHLALPLFKKSGLLFMAISDPTVENLYESRFVTGFDIRFFVVEVTKLSQVIDGIFSSKIMSDISSMHDEHVDNVTVNAYNVTVNAYKEESADFAAYDVESAPVVNYLNKVLLDAIEKKASDIHFERYEDSYRIRFRVHGVLTPITSPPLKLANYLLARIKVIANLDITEHRIPQDGRFKLIISKKQAIDFRVSVCPTLFGEKIVLRILDASHTSGGIEMLGMSDVQQKHLLSALQKSQGLILVTGPTGSGKTVTLYTALNYLNTIEKNISTVEDPVEIPVEGINQVHVNPKVGLTFASALRAFLRQDPDIIMVGEIRDLETAEIAIKAAQTGHLVLSTLHTNSAPETITRLMNMGIAPYNVAASLTVVIAQRLVRILCNECKVKEEYPESVLLAEGFTKEEIGKFQLYNPGSCDHCSHGFKGRAGIFEVLPITEEMAYMIMQGKNTLDLKKQAEKENIADLRASGLNKVKEGVTCLSELMRVFK